MEKKVNEKKENTQMPKDDDGSKVMPKKVKESRDWDMIVRDFEKEEEKNQNPDDVFKMIYANANDDARRAMNKSFTESRGTVLNMDWNSVGSKVIMPYGEDHKDKDDD